MKAFRCRVCDATLHVENSLCLHCGSALGYSRDEHALVPLTDGRYHDAGGTAWSVCPQLDVVGCTWLTREPGTLCDACRLTRTRPADDDEVGMAAWPAAEQAKRHLLLELDSLGWRVPGLAEEPETGVCFDLLSSTRTDVVIGHADGVVTIDLAETDDAHRERVRAELAEPYRTMLGHFRHEVGHYAQWRLVRDPEQLERCRALFGDEREDYQAALDRHYADGPPAGWEESHLSAYATMHPAEDFAETWAHYLHIADTIETAREYGLLAIGGVADFSAFRDLVTGVWMPLSVALNQVNRSMGKDDLYPFVIPGPALDKLDFVAELLPGVRSLR